VLRDLELATLRRSHTNTSEGSIQINRRFSAMIRSKVAEGPDASVLIKRGRGSVLMGRCNRKNSG
jgi:hypothetical protein